MSIALKLLKVFLLILAIALLCVGIYFLCSFMNWSYWIGATILAALLGIPVAIILIRKILFRRKEEGFIRQVVETDDSKLKAKPVSERVQVRDLIEHWKAALKQLKRASQGSHRKTLRSLPTFLFLGESASGKSSSLFHSGLISVFPELGQSTRLRPTRNCDWWFMEEGIFLDTAGRYATFEENSLDKDEWKKFLHLLAKQHRKKPVRGVILTLGADKLIEGESDSLQQYGNRVRRRLHHLMWVLGFRLPVYLLITKADQIPGLTAFSKMLSEDARSQALGQLNINFAHDPIEFLDDALVRISETLKEHRLAVMYDTKEINPDLIILPDQILFLKDSLEVFIETVFSDNPYQETPHFRGLYFSGLLPETEAGVPTYDTVGND